MSKINVTIVATVNPAGTEELTFYAEKVSELYKKANAIPVNKFKVSQALIGDYVPSLVSIMEFPDLESVNGVFESDEYKKLIPVREKAFSKLEAYIS